MADLRGKKFGGDITARRFGTNDPVQPLGNVTVFKTDRKSKTDTLKSTGRDNYGDALESDTTYDPAEVKFEFDTFDKMGMARMLMGDAVDLSNEPVQFTDEVHKVALGKIKLANFDIDPANLTVTDAQGQTVDPSTYALNPRVGTIEFNATSQLPVGSEIKVSGKTKGSAGYQIDAGTLENVELEIFVDGKDRVTGKSNILWMPKVKLTSDGGVDWFKDDWWKNGMTGTLISVDGKPTQRFIEFNDAK